MEYEMEYDLKNRVLKRLYNKMNQTFKQALCSLNRAPVLMIKNIR